MQLNPEQIEKLQQAVNMEINTQLTIARARTIAAQQVEEYFVTRDEFETTEPATIRAAIQFVSRPFRPLMLLLAAAVRQDETFLAPNDISPKPIPA